MAWSWEGDTSPFTQPNGANPARFVLRQIEDTRFDLAEPFVYRRNDGQMLTIDEASVGRTDLASVPWFLSWFVSPYGRHTPAALVHDQLTPEVKGVPTYLPARRDADRVILQAMDSLDVPPVRSRIIWAATVLGTKWEDRPFGLLSLVLWFLLAVLGTYLLVTGRWGVRPIFLFGPFVGALVWGRRDYWAGVVAGYGLFIVLLPGLAAVLAHYLVYWPMETAVRLVRAMMPRNRGKDLPKPVSYSDA